MPCPYGCQPTDGGPLLTVPEGFELLAESIAAGGHPDGRPQVAGAVLRRMAEEKPELIRTFVDRGKQADAKRAKEQLRKGR